MMTSQYRLNRIAVVSSLILATILVPSFFERTLSNGELIEDEDTLLMMVSGGLFLFGYLLHSYGQKISVNYHLLILSMFSLLFFELGFRGIVRLTGGEELNSNLEGLARDSYRSQMIYTGHPFTNYIGKATQIADTTKTMNSLGFGGLNHPLKKPNSEYRIAAIGGSTTANGYPSILQEKLSMLEVNNEGVSVLNFGVANWTSAHSMINYLLNVVEFKPDMLVIHHAWNDATTRDCSWEEFRFDYSHRFRCFDDSVLADAWLIRVSLVYRYMRLRFTSNQWRLLSTRIMRLNSDLSKEEMVDVRKLAPFQRNIETIIDHALSKGIGVVLTTMPYSTVYDGNLVMYREGIKESNQALRELQIKYREQIGFVDLDSLMTGKCDSLFVDIGHMNRSGHVIKAELISEEVDRIRQLASQKK